MMWCTQAVCGEGAIFKREFKVQCDKSEVPTMSSATVFALEHDTPGGEHIIINTSGHISPEAKRCNDGFLQSRELHIPMATQSTEGGGWSAYHHPQDGQSRSGRPDHRGPKRTAPPQPVCDPHTASDWEGGLSLLRLPIPEGGSKRVDKLGPLFEKITKRYKVQVRMATQVSKSVATRVARECTEAERRAVAK